MVEESRVARLHRALRQALPPHQARAVLAEAGTLTADYLLAHRIPAPAQWVLKRLPPALAARALVPAIRAHAWTFVGSGRLRAWAGTPTVFELRGNPFCLETHGTAPACAWHVAVFERLFQVLVSPRARAIETECEAQGDPVCRFELRW
jgi:divinyl protochlorophyllide a 8-vinyl-reductase